MSSIPPPSAWANHKNNKCQQQGYALLFMLVFMVLGSLYGVLNGLSSSQLAQQQADAASGGLQLARQALLAYSTAYHDQADHASEDFAYLPCPDLVGDGNAASTCGNAGEVSVGLLPYKTLGLADIRDASGNCLWYAVSGGFKNSPKSALLNWDTQGQFTIQSSTGVTEQAPNDAKGGAAAIVFSPGSPLNTGTLVQTRTITSYPCKASPSEISAYLESSGTTYTQGPVKDSAGAITNNDQLVWLTPKDIFDVLRQRSTYVTPYLTDFINIVKTQFLTPTVANQRTGSMPANPFAADTLNYNLYRNWSDQFRYYTCPTMGAYCYNLGSKKCDGVLLFSGINSGSPRATTARAAANYFEETGALAIANGGDTQSTNLYTTYSASAPSQDLTFCLGEKPAVTPFSVASVASFQSPTGSSSATVSTNGSGVSTLTLGNSSSTTIYGCSWNPSPVNISGGIRVYYRFNIQNRGEGFVFTLADSSTNSSYSMCGATGGSLGYSGSNGFTNPINSPKLGLEIDSRTSGGQSTSTNSAYRGDPSSRHAAFVFWGSTTPSNDLDNKHGAGTCPATATSPCNPNTSPGLKSLSVLNSTGVDVYVRIDIIPDATVSNRYNLYAYITSDSYIKSVCELDTLSQDVADASACSTSSSTTPTTLTSTLDTTMASAYMGFTFGQTAGSTASNEVIVISNFQAKSR